VCERHGRASKRKYRIQVGRAPFGHPSMVLSPVDTYFLNVLSRKYSDGIYFPFQNFLHSVCLQAFIWTFWAYQPSVNFYFYFEMNRIWLRPCPLWPRMHLARNSLNGPQKPYDPVVFLHTAGDAKKARHHLARMTETCNQLMSPHVKCKSDLLPTGHIWPYEPSYKFIANSHRISHLILDFGYSYSLTGFSTI